MAEWIFLDNHTKTKPSKKLTGQFSSDLQKYWLMGPSEQAKKKILELFGWKEGTFHFSPSKGEGIFQVLLGHYIDCIRETGRTHILTLETEQSCITNAIKRLEKFDVVGKFLPVNKQGQLQKETFQESIRARSSLLSLSLAHPLTGVVQPIHDLIQICRENDVRIHLDISAAIGKLYIPDLDVDFCTFDGKLFHCPGKMGGILARGELAPMHFEKEDSSTAEFLALAEALEKGQEKIDHFAMEVGRLRDLFEREIQKMGGIVFFQEVERLPNCTVIAFENLHGEVFLETLKKRGVFATTGKGDLPRILQGMKIDSKFSHCGLSFALSDETTQDEIIRALAIIQEEVHFFSSKAKYSSFGQEEAKAKNMRICQGKVGAEEEGKWICLSLLIDEEDGIIADSKYEAFGPPSLLEAAKAIAELVLRKNYMQAKRLSAQLVEGKIGPNPFVNDLLEAIDLATESCMDIPIEDIYVAPPDMEEGERQVYPNWEKLTNDQKKQVIGQVLETDVRPYVELDAGGVDVIKVEDNRITIAYSGNCTSCFSATGATLDAIGNILRHKIYPDLMVIPDVSLLQN